MKLIEEYLTRDNAEMAQDCDAVLVRGNCLCDAENLKKFKSYGINWVFTRTVGYNHFDLQAAKKLGISIARVPNYSPFAVANLAFTLGENLVHHIAEARYEVHLGDFIMHPQYFATEFNRLTIGIFGAGKIGVAEAKLWDGIGATVLAYDPFPSDQAKQYVNFVSQDELVQKSDVVSVHVSYFLKKMKTSAYLVNTARGELADTQAIADAIRSGEIAGYGGDVIVDEKHLVGKKFESIGQEPDPAVRELMSLYPKVLMTPHMGSFTKPALEDMISISYENFHEMQTKGNCKFLLK